jgi:hypothetical protein
VAGISKDAVIIDIAAAARRAAAVNFADHPWADPGHDVAADVREEVQRIEKAATDVFGGLSGDQPPVRCALGHETGASFRFCPTCGLPMDAEPPAVSSDDDSMLARVTAAELTDEERRRREEQHAAAISANQKAEQLVVDLETQPDPSTAKLLVHFVSDGFTFAGRVWHVGEELEIGPDHPRWGQALPWITLTKRQQVERYGKVFFDKGHWPYDMPPAGTELALPSIGSERLFAMRRRQGSAVPARQGDDNSLAPI